MNGTKKSKKFIIVPLILLGLLLYLLWWRYQVSAIRFFDVDEFSYMHWAAEVARGERMYIDFFSYFTPGFMWVLTPIFWILGVSVQVFATARTVSFVIFLGILGSLGYLFGTTRGWKWALLPAVILAFLPMPYDKFLEIRPDNLAVLLALLGVIGEIRGIRGKNKNWWLVSGLAYSASLLVLAKTLPIVALGAGLALIYGFAGPDARFSHPTSSLHPAAGFSGLIVHTLTILHMPKAWVAASLRAVDGSPTARATRILVFFISLAVPWALFFFWAALGGHFSQAWYSLVRLPFEVYRSVKDYPMEADLFFFPNAAFYGIGGMTAGLIVNHAIWILAVLVGAYRLVTPFGEGDKDKALIEILLGSIFVVSIFGYVKFFPLKHTQYLIPIAVFVAYYAADGLAVFFDWLARLGGYESLAVVLIGFAYLLVTVNVQVNAPKLYLSNTVQMSELTTLMHTIPFTATVVDMEGRMLFWREGYPVSSVPIDSTVSFVVRRPPPLAVYLATHPADYVWDGDSGRLGTLTIENNAYIRQHYTPVPGWGEKLWKRK